ncbi:hypothetical protein D3C73_1609260 [compost metagenome]
MLPPPTPHDLLLSSSPDDDGQNRAGFEYGLRADQRIIHKYDSLHPSHDPRLLSKTQEQRAVPILLPHAEQP